MHFPVIIDGFGVGCGRKRGERGETMLAEGDEKKLGFLAPFFGGAGRGRKRERKRRKKSRAFFRGGNFVLFWEEFRI